MEALKVTISEYFCLVQTQAVLNIKSRIRLIKLMANN